MKKYENFSKSLINLQSCRELTQPYSIAEQTGIIGLFEICFEQSWKLMKEILEYHGYNTQKTGSPRLIIKSAYQCGMITDENGWLELLNTRNILSHTYDDKKALETIKEILEKYISVFEEFKHNIDENWLI